MNDYQLVSDYKTVNIYRSGAAAKLELNRPDQLNAWDKALGLELLDAVRTLACDLVIAAESAYFLLAFVNIGLVPDGGSSLLVPSRIGFARAAELAMLG